MSAAVLCMKRHEQGWHLWRECINSYVIKSDPTWLHPEKLKVKAKMYFCCVNVDYEAACKWKYLHRFLWNVYLPCKVDEDWLRGRTNMTVRCVRYVCIYAMSMYTVIFVVVVLFAVQKGHLSISSSLSPLSLFLCAVHHFWPWIECKFLARVAVCCFVNLMIIAVIFTLCILRMYLGVTRGLSSMNVDTYHTCVMMWWYSSVLWCFKHSYVCFLICFVTLHGYVVLDFVSVEMKFTLKELL